MAKVLRMFSMSDGSIRWIGYPEKELQEIKRLATEMLDTSRYSEREDAFYELMELLDKAPHDLYD